MTTVFPAGDGDYQQDEEFQVMSWPPNSPSMHPIEYLWSHMEKQIRTATLPPSNVREFQVNVWYQIPQTTYQHLLKSMPRSVLDILRTKHDPTC